MANTALTTKDKAVSLREFLFNESRMKTFEEALPKWLSAERLLRVVFSTALKNPKILDCTKESILTAVMSCAVIGVEPILGRAYLIPYNNNKQINGKWVKVMECQFQMGYQGLIDLARRTGSISDVYAHNVYENDDFLISFGLNPNVHHVPWYMDKSKKEPGECIGAYCVWILKDGTKHSEYMPIQDIHKRRDASMAYQNDLKYNRTDSPWLKWPEDMNIKTVIKHSSKFVPSSIEFMQAVEYDNDTDEVSRVSISPFLSSGIEMDAVEKGAGSNQDALDGIVKSNRLDADHVRQFIAVAANKYGSKEDVVIDHIIDDQDGFMSEFLKWEGAAFQKSLKEEIGNLKTKGLTDWETVNRDRINNLSGEERQFFLEKWQRTVGNEYGEGEAGSFKQAMVAYRDDEKDGIGKDAFYSVLGSNGYENIDDVPESEHQKILEEMEAQRGLWDDRDSKRQSSG